MADHYRVYPHELIDGPDGTAGDLPWNFDAPDHKPRQTSDAPPADPCLTARQVAEFNRALPRHPAAIRYLHGKGVSYKTASTFDFGYGKPIAYRDAGLVMPIRAPNGGITFRLRQLPIREPKEVPPRGQSLAVWPCLPTDDEPVVLVEGPLKAAALRQRGFNAYGLCGASQYGLARQLGWHTTDVCVLWDVGVRELADNTVRAIRESGAFAWRCDLGLPTKGDDPADWFTKYGQTTGELEELIERARRAAKRRK